jgi:predicted transcriptional regulator
MNKLKSHTQSDAADAIVVSFEAKWGEILKATNVSRIFRKRAPRAIRPKYLYAYVGSPVSAVIGRLEVTALESIRSNDAIKLCPLGSISEKDLSRYSEGYDALHVYSVKPIQLCKSPISLNELQSEYSFSPPQSFLVLSVNGQAELDQKAGFANKLE